MLTLKPHPDNNFICDMRINKKIIPVFWHPKKNKELQNQIEDLAVFFTQDLRDRFEISKAQSEDILGHLKSGTVSEKNQSKFFKVKKHLDEILYTEMDISDLADSEFEINFDEDGAPAGFCGHTIVAGSTGAGKTWSQKSRLLRCLNSKKTNRRRVYWFSSEWDSDKTLRELKKDKYSEYVTGKEISDAAVKDSDFATPEEFFRSEIEMVVDNAPPNSLIIFDDPVDCCAEIQGSVRRLINKLLRVGRHKMLSVIFILHRIRSGAWSTQGSNSCRYFWLFPRSQKGACRDFINTSLGLTLGESRRMVKDFSESGRNMVAHLFHPNCLIGENLIRLI